MDLLSIAQDFTKTFLSDFEVIEQKKTERGDISLKINNSNSQVKFLIDSDPYAPNLKVIRFYDLVSKNWVNNEQEDSIYLGFWDYKDFRQCEVDKDKVQKIVENGFKKYQANNKQ